MTERKIPIPRSHPALSYWEDKRPEEWLSCSYVLDAVKTGNGPSD